MKFYKELAKYYHHIFPASEGQIEFLKEVFGPPPKEVLDIACGNGAQAIALARLGYGITAIDQAEDMIQLTREDAESSRLTMATLVCDMLTIPDHITGTFDGVFCIGNSLVHLNDESEIAVFMTYLNKLLKTDGKGIIQIINYSRILKNNITSLPTIENDGEGIAFYRDYELKDDKILFNTKLEAKGEILENTVSLLPISWEKLTNLITQAGLRIEQSYGSFNKDVFDPKTSMHWIAVITK